MKPIEILLENAALIDSDPNAVDWPSDWSRRVALERAVFGIAKHVALKRLGFTLVGLSEATRLTFLQSQCPDGPSKDLVCKAFEVRHILGQVSSGDPYLALELGEEAYGNLIRDLGRSLRDMVKLYDLTPVD